MQRRALLLSTALLGTLGPRLLLADNARQEVLLTEESLSRETPVGPWTAQLDLDAIKLATDALPVSDPSKTDPAMRHLEALVPKGTAAGLAGVFYENRDRDHSPLPPSMFPQVTHVRYDAALRRAGADYGLAGAIRFPAITLGNSSTAVTSGPAPRSLPRLAMTTPGAPERMAALYRANQLYVYPEHRDHDAVDLFPANWPYMLVSQGSSGSDQPHLKALLTALAALRPATLDRLVTEGLVTPTLQMIYRRGRRGTGSRQAYLSGPAHPSAFTADAILPEAMIAIAQALHSEDIPPAVELTIEEEDFTDAAGLAELSERLFGTPSVIARIWRGPQWQRELVVSARTTRDPNGRPLKFIWAPLRAAQGRLRIEALDEKSTAARIRLDWHDRYTAAGSRAATDRVDIGVFADNGSHLSAPAFVSISFPTHELRRYEPDGSGGMRLAEVDYDADRRETAYDPLLHWSAPWRDRWHYADGQVTELTRETASGLLKMTSASRLTDGRSVDHVTAAPVRGRRQLIMKIKA